MIETTVKYDSETFDSHTDTTVILAYSAEDIRRELQVASESQATVMFVLRPGPDGSGCGLRAGRQCHGPKSSVTNGIRALDLCQDSLALPLYS
jgi:hypothetical protein